MQEEVTRGAVTLIVDGAKLSEQVFEKAVKKFLEEIQKSQKPKIYRGRQSLKQLASQNAGLANIEISDKNIKAFSRVAKKYHVDFALKKDTSAEQPRYLVFFKSRDADAITAAFQEFASRKISREEKPSIRERLTQAKEQAAEKTEHRTIDREKVSLDVFLSDNGIFRKRNRNGAIWSLSLSAAVFYLTPVASDGFRSTLKPSAFDPAKKDGNLSAQIISQEQPVSETAALNPDWVEWLMGFPKGWTDVSSGPPSQKESPA